MRGKEIVQSYRGRGVVQGRREEGGPRVQGKGMCGVELVFASAEGDAGAKGGLMNERMCSWRIKREWENKQQKIREAKRKGKMKVINVEAPSKRPNYTKLRHWVFSPECVPFR